MTVYSGRPIIDGSIKGEAIVTMQGLNTLAVFMKSVVFKSKKAIGFDENNMDLFKKRIDGKRIRPSAIRAISRFETRVEDRSQDKRPLFPFLSQIVFYKIPIGV